MMAIRIHPLRLSDYDAMIELFRICGLDPRTRGRDAKAAIARQLRSNRAKYLGAFEGTRLVGTVLGTHDTRKGWINRLAVHPACRRRGLASRLVRACEQALRREGIEMFAALIETDNDSSKAVFETLGYEILPMIYARRKARGNV
ncbi:MAG TPA: GNAT family N-acetyltransferase [Thermoplasmata archaeon]|nr:GNAT family N-acetyltransferase [Thermoplasmata archaeon]